MHSRYLIPLLFSNTSVAASYANRVLATNPILYLRANEGTGTAIADSSGNGFNAMATDITWLAGGSPTGEPVPVFDTTAYIDFYSAGFNTAFSLDLFTVLVWVKVSSSAIWTDGLKHVILRLLRDGTNFLDLYKNVTNNQLEARFNGSGTSVFLNAASITSTGWIPILVTVDTAGNESAIYAIDNETPTEALTATATTGSGLSVNGALLGVDTKTPSNGWSGNIAGLTIWDTAVSADKLALMVL